MRGACVSWCALFTQRQPPEQGESADVSRALSLSLSALSLFLFFSHSRASPFRSFLSLFLVSLGYQRGQAPDAL